MDKVNNIQGYKVIEHSLIPIGTLVHDKDKNVFYVRNIYPFYFLGCGKTTTLEDCADNACRHALNKIFKRIDEMVPTVMLEELANNLKEYYSKQSSKNKI